MDGVTATSFPTIEPAWRQPTGRGERARCRIPISVDLAVVAIPAIQRQRSVAGIAATLRTLHDDTGLTTIIATILCRADVAAVGRTLL